MNEKPVIPLDELRARYEAIGKFDELPGERTFLGRCRDFKGFLEHGSTLSTFAQEGHSLREVRGIAPGLIELALEAWPNGYK